MIPELQPTHRAYAARTGREWTETTTDVTATRDDVVRSIQRAGLATDAWADYEPFPGGSEMAYRVSDRLKEEMKSAWQEAGTYAVDRLQPGEFVVVGDHAFFVAGGKLQARRHPCR